MILLAGTDGEAGRDRRHYLPWDETSVPRQLRAIKEGVGEKASAPQSAGEIPAISRDEPRTKEQSYFRSPTENH